MALSRLDKLIALNCNVSRKDARQLIKDGKVILNGSPALRAQELVDTQSDELSVDGYDFSLKEHIYIMMNKPAGVISATKDDNKRTVTDIIPPNLMRKSLFPVGRLDRDTTGLLIITDDGEYAHKLMSPNHEINKTYVAGLSDGLTEEAIAKIEGGIVLADGTRCLEAKVAKLGEKTAEITISEGKYHQVKRMFAAAGNHVETLRRISIGRLHLDESLKEGECREMTDEEVALALG